MTLKALIFDVDGTLAETEEIHRQAFNETFAGEDLDWHWDHETYRALLKVTGGKERMRAYRDGLGWKRPDSATIARLHALKTVRYGEILASGGLSLRPGVGALIAAARSRGLLVAVATTTSGPNVEALTMSCFGCPADRLFDAIAAGDEVAQKKPSPDVYLLALDRLGVAPCAALAFEDSRNGLRAAMAAGLATVVTPSRYTDDEDFTGAVLCVPGLDHPGVSSLCGVSGSRP